MLGNLSLALKTMLSVSVLAGAFAAQFGLSTLAAQSVNQPHHLAWSRDGQYLAILGSQKLAIFTDLTSERPTTLKVLTDTVQPLALDWSPDTKRLVVAYGEEQAVAEILDFETGRMVQKLPLHVDLTYRRVLARWNAEGSLLATGSVGEQPDIELWDARSFQKLRNYRGGSYYGFEWNPKRDILAVGNVFALFVIDHYAAGAPSRTLLKLGTLPEEQVTAFAWNPEGTRIAIANSQAIRIVTADEGAILQSLEHSVKYVDAISWSPGSNLLVVAGNEGNIQIYELASQRLVRNLSFVRTQFSVPMAWSPTGARLAYIGKAPTPQPAYLLSLADDQVHIVVPVASAERLEQIAELCAPQGKTATDVLTALRGVESALTTLGVSSGCRDDLRAMVTALGQ